MTLFFKIIKDKNSEQGFTLLELLMVVAILSAVAWMALGTVTNDMGQVRYEDTRNRLNAIRKAIIGDTSRTLNGGPQISGYVADIGELPSELNALIQKDYCPDHPEIDNSTDCATAGETWEDSRPTYTYNSTYGIWAGWRGPYLNAAELTDYPKFLDGWGNNDDSGNFGWTYIPDFPDSGELTVQSLGMDGVSDNDGGGTGDYEADYPYGNPHDADTSNDPQPILYQNEYRTLITDDGPTSAPGDGSSGLYIDFGTPTGCWRCNGGSDTNRKYCEDPSGTNGIWEPVFSAGEESDCTDVWLPDNTDTEDVCLRVAYRTTSVPDGIDKMESVDTAYNGSANQTFTWDGITNQKIKFLFQDNTHLPQGQLAYKVFEYDGTATPSCTTIEFPKGAVDWELFTIVPGSVIQTLKWDVNEK